MSIAQRLDFLRVLYGPRSCITGVVCKYPQLTFQLTLLGHSMSLTRVFLRLFLIEPDILRCI